MERAYGETREYVFDPSDERSLLEYASKLEGMTFREVIELGITPEGVTYEDSDSFNLRKKGGYGVLIEERYFGYGANSDSRPDFVEAGVELKTTCFDLKLDGTPSAGERLVITMIPFDEVIEKDFYESGVWEKTSKILLIFYRRERGTDDPLGQRIEYVMLFTPSAEDLKIIEDDYKKIQSYIVAGRAHELSEGLTMYLGAATKGATEATMWVDQFYDSDHRAKRRAFSLKRQYMDFILRGLIAERETELESIVSDIDVLAGHTLEEYILSLIDRFRGRSARDIAAVFDIEYNEAKKNLFSMIGRRMIGLYTQTAEEIEKAAIDIRSVRLEEDGKMKESISFKSIDFISMMSEEWEDTELRNHFEETKFLFMVFQRRGSDYYLTGGSFWNMPVEDIDGPLRDCWSETKKVVSEGVIFKRSISSDGKVRILNNLPGAKDNRVAHVRPHARKRAYRFRSGEVIGDIERDAIELPDGAWMTKQSFWLNNRYVEGVLTSLGLR